MKKCAYQAIESQSLLGCTGRLASSIVCLMIVGSMLMRSMLMRSMLMRSMLMRSMLMRSMLWASILWPFMSCPSAHAQEATRRGAEVKPEAVEQTVDSTSKALQITRRTLLVPSRGLIFRVIQSQRFAATPPVLTDLRKEPLCSLLQLSPRQKADLEKLDSDFRDLIKGVAEAIAGRGGAVASANPPADAEKLAGVGRLTEQAEAIQQQLESLLIKRQRETVANLRLRRKIATMGLENYVAENQLSVEPGFQKALALERDRYAKRVSVIIKEYTEEIAGVLNDSQLELLRSMGDGEPSKYAYGFIELMHWQQQSRQAEAGEHEPYASIEPMWLKMFILNERSGFRVSLDGRLIRSEFPGQPIALKLMRICNSTIYGGLEVLPEVQMGFANKESDQAKAKRESMVKRGRQLLKEIADGSLSRREGMKALRGLKAELEIWRVQQFYDELLPFQESQLKSVLFRRSISTEGLARTLLSYRRDFELRSAQVEQLRQISRRWSKRLGEAARELELQGWRGIADQVSEPAIGDIRRLVEDHPQIAGLPYLLFRPAEQKEWLSPRRLID